MLKKQSKHARRFNSIACWAEVDGKRKYFRSKKELSYARHLEFLKKIGEIKDFEHEPHTFYFDGIKRGVTNYKPDFKVFRLDGTHVWIEVKGYMDAKSATKIKRFRKYFPEEQLIVIS